MKNKNSLNVTIAKKDTLLDVLFYSPIIYNGKTSVAILSSNDQSLMRGITALNTRLST